MTNLVGLSRTELTNLVTNLGEKPFRAKQIWHWIYNRGETSFDAMTTLSQELRKELADK